MPETRTPTLAAAVARHTRAARALDVTADVTLTAPGAGGFVVARVDPCDARDPQAYLHVDRLQRDGSTWVAGIDAGLGIEIEKIVVRLPTPARLPRAAVLPDLGDVLRRASLRLPPDVFDRLGSPIAIPLTGICVCDENADPLPGCPLRWRSDATLTAMINDLTLLPRDGTQDALGARILHDALAETMDALAAQPAIFAGATVVALRLRFARPTAHERMADAARSGSTA